MKKFVFVLRRINAFACDLTLSYALFYLLLFVRPVGFPIIVYYFAVLVLYFGLTHAIFKAGFMQKLFGIEIEKRLVKYTVFKILWIGIIPLFISFIFTKFIVGGALIGLILLLLTVLHLLITKKSLWQWCSGARVELKKNPYRNKKLIAITLLATFALLCFQVIRQSDHLRIINNKHIAIPISIPEKAYFVKNIQHYKQEPVNYIMQLFDRYDIVILCERYHTDITQWNFFSEIILNDAFAGKVKNVFTEIGNFENQELLDTYMNTHFADEEDLQRATAQIVRENGGVWPLWPATNAFNFILHLHQFNEKKDSIDRIRYFFTDIHINWDEIQNPAQWDSIRTHTHRDSIMAYNVINRYDSLRLNKSLVILNSRHAWNYGDGDNAADYIFKKYLGKTAAVWINGCTQFASPAMKGTLDESALEIPDSIWAIDFQDCPLGNIHFDLFPPKKSPFTYKDLFAGMVYYMHPSDWKPMINYPFMMDNFKDTYLKRHALIGVGEDVLRARSDLIDSGYYDKIQQFESVYPSEFNRYFLILHSVILLFLCLNLLVLLCKKQKKQELEQ